MDQVYVVDRGTEAVDPEPKKMEMEATSQLQVNICSDRVTLYFLGLSEVEVSHHAIVPHNRILLTPPSGKIFKRT